MSGKDVAMVVHLARSPSPARPREESRALRAPVTLVVVPDLLIPQWVEKAVASGMDIQDVLMLVHASDVRRGNAWKNIHRSAKRIVVMTAEAFNAYVIVSKQQAEAAASVEHGTLCFVEELVDAQQTIGELGWPVILDRLVFDHPEALALSRVARCRHLPAHDFSWVITSTFSDREDPLDAFRGHRRPNAVERLVARRADATSVVRCSQMPASFERHSYIPRSIIETDVVDPPVDATEAVPPSGLGWNVRRVLEALDAGEGEKAAGLCGIPTVYEDGGELEDAVRSVREGSSASSVAEAVARAKNDQVCPIGMEDEPVRLKTVTLGCCQNVFDFANLLMGLCKSPTCPLCARPISPSDVVVVLPRLAVSEMPQQPRTLITPLVRSCETLKQQRPRRDVADVVTSDTRRVLDEAPHHRVLIVFDYATTPIDSHERDIVNGTGGKRLYSARLKTVWNRIDQFRSGDPASRVLVGKFGINGIGLDLGNVSHVFMVASGHLGSRNDVVIAFSRLVASARSGDTSRLVTLKTFIVSQSS